MTWIDSLSEEERSTLRKQRQPDWIAPMLATLIRDHFSDPSWIYERKLDGQRLLAFRDGSEVRLMSRNKKPNERRYPEVRDALATFSSDEFVIDGEIVAFDGNVSSFSKLQPRMQIDEEDAARAAGVSVYYYVFDLLHLDGYDVSRLPLRARKAILRKVFAFADPVRYTTHRNEHGEAFLEEACEKGWEGLIAKDSTAPYKHGRSRNWLKFKCSNIQEFVIGGYTDPKGSRTGFGALLIGYYEERDLHYAGKVGTGYDDETLERLHAMLKSIERKTPPFAADDLPSYGVHWVAPKVVAQIGFTEWTRDGKLRHPRYLGLRDDKVPKTVTREQPNAVAT